MALIMHDLDPLQSREPRDYEVREHIPHTWVSSNDSFFNLILARGHTAPLF